MTAGPLDRIDVAAGEGGDTAEPLKEIEGNALAGKERTGLAANDGDYLSIARGVARVFLDGHFVEEEVKQFRAGEGHLLPGVEAAFGAQIGRDASVGGDVTGTDVFVQRAIDGIHDLGMIDIE